MQDSMIVVVDRVSCLQISGWARDRQSPHERVELTLGNDQGLALQTLADRIWQPFAALGGSVGRCAFSFDLRGVAMPEAASPFDLVARSQRSSRHEVLQQVPGRPAAGYDIDRGKGSSTAWLTRLGHYRFDYPGRIGAVRLHSSAVHGTADARLLGAAVSRVKVNGAALDMQDDRVFVGFHGMEGAGDGAYRWMPDTATICFPDPENTVCVEFDVTNFQAAT